MYLLERCLLVKYLHEGTLSAIASGGELAGSRSGESAWGVWGVGARGGGEETSVLHSRCSDTSSVATS